MGTFAHRLLMPVALSSASLRPIASLHQLRRMMPASSISSSRAECEWPERQFFSRLSSTCSSFVGGAGCGPSNGSNWRTISRVLKSKLSVRSKSLPSPGTWSISAGRSQGDSWRSLQRHEAGHVADDLGGALAGLLDAVEQARYLACLHVVLNGFQADAGLFGLFDDLFQTRRQAPAGLFCTLCRMAPSRLLISCAMPAARPPTESIFSTAPSISPGQALGDVVDTDHPPRPAPPTSG